MLRFLSIRRLAVIDALEVQFEPGLNVLTGETGAGKSILVEAVGLLLGGRASADLVRTGEDAAAIEAIFDTGGEEVIVRREITAQGRSRSFIDGGLATAGALRDLAARHVELHGQHEHQTLFDPDSHLHALDAFAGLEPLTAAVGSAYDRMRFCGDEMAGWRRTVEDRAAKQEWAEFQLAELERASLKASEDEELGAVRHMLVHAERVQRLCDESFATLYENDAAILPALGGVWRRVAELAAIDSRFLPYVEARDGIKAGLEDLADFLRRFSQAVDGSPARLQQVEERLALIDRLKRKHGPTLADVIARRDALRQELAGIENTEQRRAELERQFEAARREYCGAADDLSSTRRRAAAELERQLVTMLGELALDGTRFEVRFADQAPSDSARTRSGTDRVEFFVSANPGEELRPLARIVSGGELSRIMLALKTLTAASRLGPSTGGRRPGALAPALIFDEVDAGIGGRVADVVGRSLRRLGSAFQVLCITHLPQIAAHADTHFQVDKQLKGGRTTTSVRRLGEHARVDELSRMLAGAGITDSIRATAREMLIGRQGTGRAARENREAKAKGESERPRPSRNAWRENT